MLSSNAYHNERGFTLIENLVIVVIVGILAAISAPSFLSWYNRAQVNNALTQVRGALQEAQREAIKKSRDCIVTLPPSGTEDPTIISPCFVTGDRTLDGITIRHNYSSNSITFNYRGGTNNPGTIVLHIPNSINPQKCMVTSIGIGLMRTGDYEGTEITAEPEANDCNKTSG